MWFKELRDCDCEILRRVYLKNKNSFTNIEMKILSNLLRAHTSSQCPIVFQESATNSTSCPGKGLLTSEPSTLIELPCLGRLQNPI